MTSHNTNRIYYCDPHSIFSPQPYGEKVQINAAIDTGTALQNGQYVTSSNGKEKTDREEELHSAPDQRQLIQLWIGRIYMELAGIVSLNVSCVRQLFKRK